MFLHLDEDKSHLQELSLFIFILSFFLSLNRLKFTIKFYRKHYREHYWGSQKNLIKLYYMDCILLILLYIKKELDIYRIK